MIARRLGTISRDVTLPETEAARERIERYCEHLEQGILHEFAEAYQSGDTEHVAVLFIFLLTLFGSCVLACCMNLMAVPAAYNFI